jgi:hypothetical protein
LRHLDEVQRILQRKAPHRFRWTLLAAAGLLTLLGTLGVASFSRIAGARTVQREKIQKVLEAAEEQHSPLPDSVPPEGRLASMP